MYVNKFTRYVLRTYVSNNAYLHVHMLNILYIYIIYIIRYGRSNKNQRTYSQSWVGTLPHISLLYPCELFTSPFRKEDASLSSLYCMILGSSLRFQADILAFLCCKICKSCAVLILPTNWYFVIGWNPTSRADEKERERERCSLAALNVVPGRVLSWPRKFICLIDLFRNVLEYIPHSVLRLR